MAFKDLLVNYAKTQTRLAVTAMKVSVRCITTLHWKPHAVSSFLCFNPFTPKAAKSGHKGSGYLSRL